MSRARRTPRSRHGVGLIGPPSGDMDLGERREEAALLVLVANLAEGRDRRLDEGLCPFQLSTSVMDDAEVPLDVGLEPPVVDLAADREGHLKVALGRFETTGLDVAQPRLESAIASASRSPSSRPRASASA